MRLYSDPLVKVNENQMTLFCLESSAATLLGIQVHEVSVWTVWPGVDTKPGRYSEC